MATFQNGLGQMSSSGPSQLKSRANHPTAQIAQQASQDAMEFQLWVGQQATALSKMKVFSSMAKSVNDQQ